MKSARARVFITLTRQPDGKSALAGSMGGSLFEGLVISEAFKAFSMKGKRPDIFFWRSNEGLEVDLIILLGEKLFPVEIKLTATPSPRHMEPLEKFKALSKEEGGGTGLLVCRVPKTVSLPSGNIALPWNEFTDWIMDRL